MLRELPTSECWGVLFSVDSTADIRFEIVDDTCEAFLSTCKSRSIVSPILLKQPPPRVPGLTAACVSSVANGGMLHIEHAVTGIIMQCSCEWPLVGFQFGPNYYNLVLGLNWRVRRKAAWTFQSDKLRPYVSETAWGSRGVH